MNPIFTLSVHMAANYVPVTVQADKGVFEYTVAFNPPIDSRDLRFRMLAQKVDVIGPVRNFDGVKLYLPIRLPHKVRSNTCLSFVIICAF